MALRTLFFVLLLIPLFIKAQNENQGSQAERLFQAQLSGEVFTPPVLFSGSPWFIDNWIQGRVILSNEESVNNIMLRYNGYLDELFLLDAGVFEQIMLDKYLISSFELIDHEKGTTHHFELMNNSGVLIGDNSRVFMQLLYENEVSLYVYRKIRETGSTTSGIIGGKLVQRRVIGPDYQYFIKRKGFDPQPVRLSKRSLIKYFQDYRSEIRRDFRQQNIRIRNEVQLINAVDIINSTLGFSN